MQKESEINLRRTRTVAVARARSVGRSVRPATSKMQFHAAASTKGKVVLAYRCSPVAVYNAQSLFGVLFRALFSLKGCVNLTPAAT